MADEHDHSHDSNYADQLFALGVCGLIGGLAIILWYQSRLGDLLNPSFHVWVLLTGVILCGIVLIRGVAVWFSLKPAAAHTHDHGHDHAHDHAHDHDHGHDHAHDHAHHSHEHGHDHSHDHPPAPAANDDGHDHSGWAPWRYIVLLLVAGGSLFVLWIPPGALPAATQVYFAKQGGQKVAELETPEAAAPKKEGELHVTFLQLEQAAMDKDAMDDYTGKTIHVSGRYVGDDGKRFRLVRYKMTCCMADAIPLNAVIMVDRESNESLDFNNLRYKWVEVTGRVQFLHPPGSNAFVPAVILTPTKEKPLSELVKVVPPDPNPYAN